MRATLQVQHDRHTVAHRTVADEVWAAEVAAAVVDVHNDLSAHYSQLVEIHAARYVTRFMLLRLLLLCRMCDTTFQPTSARWSRFTRRWSGFGPAA